MFAPKRRAARILALVLIAAAGTATLLAGPLNPPAGTIGSTYKTLTEVEPRIAINATNTPGDSISVFRITQPGSYYLTGNIAGVAGKNGIAIRASGVHVDLNGFDVVGVPGSLNGVAITLSIMTGVSIVNGSVRNWGGDGVNTVGGESCRVENVIATANGGSGILMTTGSAVTACTASYNAGCGIGSTSNWMMGVTVANCTAAYNQGDGIAGYSGCTITGCSAYHNTGNGISTSAGCLISSCCANINTGTGISAGTTCPVIGCVAQGNGVCGISAQNCCLIADCTVRSSTQDGILCATACTIRGNTCSFGGNGAGDGAGIHATGQDNRVEANTCTYSDRGIDVDSVGNIIIRNSVSGCTTNWDVVAGNTILVVNGTSAPAVLGTAGGVAPGSTDPNANFSY